MKEEDSPFGIDDCNPPRRNTRKNRAFFQKKNKSVKRRSSKPYNYETIILFPHALGQSRGGVDKAPRFLKKFINKKRHVIKNVPNTGNFFKNIQNLYKANAQTQGNIVNIGGDHSMAIATIADTMNKFPDARVIYFDAHADINTFASSKSKHYHGMPLSFVTGIDKNSHFNFIKNTLPLDNILYIGSRCWDPPEVDTVYKHGIKFLTPDEINKDFNRSMNLILDFVGDSPLHVSFDVDSIDPRYIPSTGTPVKNGIKLANAIKILDQLNAGKLVSLDITELNMDLGSKADGKKSGKYAEKLFDRFLR